MLKIYDARPVFQIDRQQWEACGTIGYVCRDDSDIPEEQVILDRCPFSQAYRAIYDNYFNGLYADETLFLHRSYIGVAGGCRSAGMRYFAGDIRTISYKIIYRERKYVSIDWITEHLTVEQAIQYFKDRGMTTYPLVLR